MQLLCIHLSASYALTLELKKGDKADIQHSL